MLNKRAIPAAKLTIPLIIGIVSQGKVPFDIAIYAASLSFSAFFFIIFIFRSSLSKQIIRSILVFIFLSSTGNILTKQFHQNRQTTLPEDSTFLKGTITDIKKVTDSTISFEYLVQSYKSKNKWLNTPNKQKILVRCKKANSTYVLQQNNKLLIKGYLKAILPTDSPHTIDFKKIYAQKNIYSHFYTNQNKVAILPNQTNWLSQYKSEFITFLFEHLPQEKAAFITALVANEKEFIKIDLKNKITKNGISHLIAISGLHIGIIYLLLIYIAKKIPATYTKSRIFTSLGICFTLIIYGTFCGFSPSIARSVTMFCVMEIAQIINRKNNSINSLFVAAFLILIIKPSEFYSVGFQLSFAGVLGILFFYKQINYWLTVEIHFIKKLWEAFSVTLAAQLGVLPLLIYYFKKVALNGLFLSIILTLLTAFLVSLGISLLLLFKLPYINQALIYIIGWLSSLFLWVLDLSNTYLFSVSFEKTSLPKIILLYVVIFYSFKFIKHKKVITLKILTTCFILFFIYQTAYQQLSSSSKNTFIYCENEQLTIEHNFIKQIVNEKKDEKFASKSINGNRLFSINKQLILFQNNQILKNYPSINTLVLSKEIPIKIVNKLNAKHLLFDKKIRQSYIMKLISHYPNKEAIYHSLKKDGFFTTP